MANNKIKFTNEELIDLKNQGLSIKDITIRLNSSYQTVSRKLIELGLHTKKEVVKRRTYTINDDFLNEIDTEEKAYFLGFMYADGCVTSNDSITIQLKIDDEDHLIKLKNLLSKDKPVQYVESRYSEDHPITKKVRFTIVSEQLSNRLIEYGCVKKKSLILTFPEFLSKELIPHFIRGYFDGDGSVYLSQVRGVPDKSIGFSFIGTLNMIENINLNLRLPSKTKIQKDMRSKNDIYYINYGAINNALAFYNYIYSNATIFLERKKKIFNNYFDMRESQRLPSSDPIE